MKITLNEDMAELEKTAMKIKRDRDALLEAAKILSIACGPIESKENQLGYKYLSPSGIMVDTELVIALRAAIARAEVK